MGDVEEGKPSPGQPVEGPSRCQVCGEALSSKIVVICHRCKTPHHEECWRYNRGCSVYGCGCRTSEMPSPASAELEGRFTVEAPPSQKTFWLLFAISLAGFFGGLAAISLTPLALAFAIPWYAVTLTGAVLYQAKGRYRLDFDPETGRVSRQFLCMGKRLGKREEWLRAEDVVEVHLHRYVQNQFVRIQALWVACRDGERRFVTMAQSMHGAECDGTVEEQAEAIAAWADTTVRFLATEEAPSRAEILEAAEQKAMEGPAPRPLLPED